MKSIFTKYYGEYSLRYWVQLLLKKDIVLPKFQRPFVWEQEKVNSFISSLKTNHFVPPVVIGNYFDENKSRNYILTALLFIIKGIIFWNFKAVTINVKKVIS